MCIRDSINKEIQKTREKITEYQNKLRGLEAQKTEAENLEKMCIRDRDNDVFATAGFAQKNNCALTRLDYLQEAGFMSSIPLGPPTTFEELFHFE